MKVVEHFIRSKLGSNLASCEDNFCVTDHYACVVDGATSVTKRRWTSEAITGGQWASRILVERVKNLSPCCTAHEVVNQLTKAIYESYKTEGVVDTMENRPDERATASIILYSRHLNCLISVGDCQAALLDSPGRIFQRFQPSKYTDEVMSKARCMILQLEIAKGKTVQEILKEPDVGRAFIEPLRMGQKLFQNNPNAPEAYQYWVMDGFPVSPEAGIVLHKIPKETNQIILASDGYPMLHSTLKNTEDALNSLVKNDPLLMAKYLSTKGVAIGAESFDDRTFLRIGIDCRQILG